VTEQRDIVERLDALNKLYWEDCRMPYSEAGDVFEEAAAEITSLREQLRIAREGLQRCSDDYGDGAPSIAAEYLARMDQEARNDH
jgi:hypothetical protein